MSKNGELTKEEYKGILKSWQDTDQAPDWMTWMGVQTLLGGYLGENETPRERYSKIAEKLASYLPEDNDAWAQKFFDITWKGWLAYSTPVLANTATNKGMSVSCSGNYVEDSLDSIYKGLHENAMLTKYGFGTSSDMSTLRGRGAIISRGGHSSGLVSWIEQYRYMTSTVTQGATRRGAWAGYIRIESVDFDSVMEYIMKTSHINVGILISDDFIKRLQSGDLDAMRRYLKLLEMRMITGRPYVIFIDRANRQNPESYILNNLLCKASNLCTEIFLFSDAEHTYTCVLSSMNAAKFDEWKDTDAVEIATVLLDCVAEDFIKRGELLPGLEKTVRFTKKGRSLGLGLLGFHTYLQQKGIAVDDLQAQFQNDIIFKHLHDKSLDASKMMAEWLGEPEWCEGLGVRNTHRLAVAPNTTSALLCGSVSQGCEITSSNLFIQKSAKGKFERINPVLLIRLRELGKDSKEVRKSIAFNKGSVHHLDFLNDQEKRVFRTAFEVNQKRVIELAERRQKYICQGQSLNLFFSDSEDPGWIHEVHKAAFEANLLKSLYYVRTEPGITADKGEECVACEG